MHLLVGLGNPGSLYKNNRHNVGFMCLDEIRESYGFPLEKAKFSGLFTEGNIGKERGALFKPLTYMNKSGRPVAEVSRFFKIPPSRIVVFHDDIDLECGVVRVKQGGGHGGHNGLRDLDAHIGKSYWRVRIGIGRPLDKSQVSAYVLEDFSKEDQTWLTVLKRVLADEVHLLFKDTPQDYGTKVMMESSRGL